MIIQLYHFIFVSFQSKPNPNPNPNPNPVDAGDERLHKSSGLRSVAPEIGDEG